MVKPEGLKNLNIHVNVINGIHMYNVKYLSNLLHVQYKTASQVIFKFHNTIHIEMQNANYREKERAVVPWMYSKYVWVEI